MRRALHELGSKRKEIKYVGLLGQNIFDVSNQEGKSRKKTKIQ